MPWFLAFWQKAVIAMKHLFNKIWALFIVMLLILSLMAFHADAQNAFDEISVYCNNVKVEFSVLPVIEDGRTLVPVRPVLEAMNCAVRWKGETRTIEVQSGSIIVELVIDSDQMLVKKNTGNRTVALDVPPQIIQNATFLPIRAVVEEFGATVQWNGDAQRIDITYAKGVRPTEEPTAEPTPMPTARPTAAPTAKPTASPTRDPDAETTPTPTEVPKGGRIQNGHTFYYQSEPAWGFPGNGSGYCWVCSYAMLLNDTVGDVTPRDVAKVNEELGVSGNFCYHTAIVNEFDAKFVPALSTDSEYFERYDAGKGATYINNPEEEDEVAVAALKEALKRNPAGVLVRFDKRYPHTVVAVGFEGDTIYFNDPANKNGGVNVSGMNGKIPFENIYPGYKGVPISELSFIQAIKKK